MDQGKETVSIPNAELLQKSWFLEVPTPPLVHGTSPKTAAKCHQQRYCWLALSHCLGPLHLETIAPFVRVLFMDLHISFPFLFLSMSVPDNERWHMIVITAGWLGLLGFFFNFP